MENNESWNVIYDTDNVDEAYDSFINIISALYNECRPYAQPEYPTYSQKISW